MVFCCNDAYAQMGILKGKIWNDMNGNGSYAKQLTPSSVCFCTSNASVGSLSFNNAIFFLLYQIVIKNFHNTACTHRQECRMFISE